MRRALLLCLVALMAGGGTAVAQPIATSLKPGESAFWRGPMVDRAIVQVGELCGIVGPCWEYGIEAGRSAPGSRLRVAIDWPDNVNSYALELRSPSGRLIGPVSGLGSWSDELYAPDPEPGRWTVRVVPEDVTASSFKVRAKLERPKREPAEPRLLLPNLQANPPWDPTFVAPAGPFTHRPADVFGIHPLSCTLDESLINGVERCLRFSVGPMNVGRGPYEARFDLASARPNAGGHLEGPVIQRIYRSDGSYLDREAGEFEAHETHAHFHVQALLAYKLFRVADRRRGVLEPAGAGAKASFCTLDLMIAKWRRFTSEGPRWRGPSPCAVPPEGDTTLVMGISPGWADVYTWDLPDQYVDFGDSGEGFFVIRATVDQGNTLRETDERDNVGYALVRVAGDRARLIERGLGRSPWDPDKRVLPLAP